MSKEALKLVLEAVKQAHDESLDENHFECRRILMEQITAIKEALEQPEPVQQEPVPEQRNYSCKVCGNKPDYEGVLEHGRGCYVMQSEGGGSEYIVAACKKPEQKSVACLSETQARVILDLALDLEKTGRLVAITEGQERTDFVARNRNIQCALEDALRNATAQQPAQQHPATVPSRVTDALHSLDDFVARCSGNDRGSDASVNTIRSFLQSLAKQPALQQEPVYTEPPQRKPQQELDELRPDLVETIRRLDSMEGRYGR